MARTTRATRQQRDVEGTDVSPLVSLDDHPRRHKTNKKVVTEDSSTNSKKSHQAQPAEEAPAKTKQPSKKATQEGTATEKPAKAKPTSKKASQEEPLEEVAVQVKNTSKKPQESEQGEKSPVKAKQASKKTQESEPAEKSPVKAKSTKKAQQEEATKEATEGVPVKSKTPRAKKVTSGDKPAKATGAESPTKHAQTNHKPAAGEASKDQSDAIVPTSPVKAALARARSPAKDATTDAHGKDDATHGEEPTAENPTSPVKAALARARSPAKDATADTHDKDDATHGEELTAENPTSPVKAALARARSPAKSSPAKQPASQNRQKDMPTEHQLDSTTLDTFPFALKSSSSLSPSPIALSSSPIPSQGIKADSALFDTPCPNGRPPTWKESIEALNIEWGLSGACGVSGQSGPASSTLALGPSNPTYRKPSPDHGQAALVPRSPTVDNGQPNLVSALAPSQRSSLGDVDALPGTATVPSIATKQRSSLIATPKDMVTSSSQASASIAAPTLNPRNKSVPGTFLSEHKAVESKDNSFSLLSQPQALKRVSVVTPYATREPQVDPDLNPELYDQEIDESLELSSPPEDKPAPVVTGRLQRQLNREAKGYVKFWMEPDTFATPRERSLQGTYCIPKITFLNFLLALRPEQKVLTEIASPQTQNLSKAPSTQQSPQNASSNDSTPIKRKLELPAPNDERPSPSKRLRTEQKPRITKTRSPAKTNGVRISTKSPVKPKRYAKQGGYDKNGNLIFPGQELFDSTTDEEITKAPPALISPSSPLAVLKQPSRAQNAGPRSPAKSSYDAPGPKLPSKSATPRQDEILSPTNNFNLPTTPTHVQQSSVPPATAPNFGTPGRRWNLAGRVTASIGKLNPFSLFTRSTQPLAHQPVPTLAFEPIVKPVIEPVFVPVTEHAISRTDLASAPDAMDTDQDTSDDHQELTLADAPDPQSEIPDLLLSVLQQRCPDIADEKLVSTVQASFTQSEGLARHKAEEAQQRLESITDPVTKRLLILLERQYPDLSAIGILAKLDELINQQQIVANFKNERARKQRLPESEVSKATKRKRAASPDIIPNPIGKSYGMDLDFFGSSSDSDEGDDEQQSELERPSKMPRLEKETTLPRLVYPRRHLGSEPAPAAKRRAQVHFQSNSATKPKEDPKRASPYVGNVFRDSYQAPGNIFSAGGAQESASTSKSTGHFEVPISSSDSEDSDSELPATPSKTSASAQPKTASGGRSILKGSPLNAAAKAAKEAAAKETPNKSTPPQEAGKDSRAAPSPPPAPTPAHAALPTAPVSQSQHDPVALARAQANKYAPKTSSKLKSVSRLSNSPANKASAGNLLGAGRDGTKRNANIKLVNFPDDYDLDPEVFGVAQQWDRKPLVEWSYEVDPAIGDGFAAWDSLEIDPVATYELDPEVAAFLSSIEYD